MHATKMLRHAWLDNPSYCFISSLLSSNSLSSLLSSHPPASTPTPYSSHTIPPKRTILSHPLDQSSSLHSTMAIPGFPSKPTSKRMNSWHLLKSAPLTTSHIPSHFIPGAGMLAGPRQAALPARRSTNEALGRVRPKNRGEG